MSLSGQVKPRGLISLQMCVQKNTKQTNKDVLYIHTEKYDPFKLLLKPGSELLGNKTKQRYAVGGKLAHRFGLEMTAGDSSSITCA